MKPSIVHDQEDLRFYATLASGEEAELTYTFPEEKVMDFDYTFVPEKHRNQGLADQLVKAGLEHAREKGYRVIPSCPAVETYVKRHKEYENIIYWI
jgi:predicted GNAT family acetyltransferase